MKKKIICLFFFLCFSILLCCQKNECVYAQTSQYARIKYVSTYLYKNPVSSNEMDNILFSLPQTYFVELLSIENEAFYKAKYLDTIGFVKKSEVDCISGIPQNPYASTISFRVFAQNGLNLRTSPTTSEGIFNKVTAVPYLENNLQYYGSASGEESVPYRGNEWYYCKYFTQTESFVGYLYSGYCDLKTNIVANTEIFEIISEPRFETTSTKHEEKDIVVSSLDRMSTTAQTLIIVGVSIPALLIVYLIFKPSKIAEKSAVKNRTRKKRRKYKGDYYEVED